MNFLENLKEFIFGINKEIIVSFSGIIISAISLFLSIKNYFLQKKYMKIQNELNKIQIDNEKEKKKVKWDIKSEKYNQIQYRLIIKNIGQNEAKNVVIEILNSVWDFASEGYTPTKIRELGDIDSGFTISLPLYRAGHFERKIILSLKWTELGEEKHKILDLFLN